ncbi:MAG: Gfo/Idh/MocA family oxidoreductase [Polyangia bacterium]|jgi:predicted dehydrogenase|nr:Gfo/Idh/MocA family oxidoreductase [Polyangia bacterium]
MPEPIQVGFIGCGRIADLHALGYKGRKDARIYAVCDTDEATVERRMAEWGAQKGFTDHRALLADPKVQAVEILTPQKLHEPMVLEALAASKHVAVQKPMTVSLPSADRMIAAARGSGRIFKVTENYWFYPPILRARALLDSGAIGEVRGLRIKLIGGPTGGWEVPASAWKWRVEEMAEGRGFATFDHGHHLWSTALLLLGPAERVVAWIDSADGVADCPATVMWKAKGRVSYGVCDLHQAAELNVPSRYYSNDEWMELTGDQGLIFIHRCTGNIHQGPVLSRFDGRAWHHEGPDTLESDWASGFVGATRNFLAAIRGEEAPHLDGPEAREVLRFALAIARSARWRREVYLDELDSPAPILHAAALRWTDIWRRLGAPALGRILEDAMGGVLGGAMGGALEGAMGGVLGGAFGGNTSRFAARAVELTEALVARHDAEAARRSSTVIGLHLTPDGGVEERFGLRVSEGQVELTRGAIPPDALLTVWMPAGLWAAILLRERRIETALLQGRIRFEGKAEEALKLRDVFGL